MKRGLRRRLALACVAVAVLAILVAGILVAVTSARHFDSYLERVQAERSADVVAALRSTWRDPDGWDATAIYALSQVATSNDVDVAVYDPDARLLFTVQGRSPGPGPHGGQGAAADQTATEVATETPQATPVDPSSFTILREPVVVDGRNVATAEVYAGEGVRTAAEEAYRDSLARDLIVAAVVAAIVAVLVSLLVSRRITGPLEELSDAAADVAAGRLDVRVSPRGDDEVAVLGGAFNSMADRLARDEQWRREMTSDLTHELRAPLEAIRSRVEALQDGAEPATPEDLRSVGEEVERLSRLLGALHQLNELEDEDLGVEYEEVDLAAVTAAAAEQHRPAFDAKGVALATDLRAAVVPGDRDRLLQVADVLLDNALTFTPEGGRVTVSVAAADTGPGGAEAPQGPAGRAACLTVRDSGPGIDPVDLPFVFDRFYRAQARRGASGAGLGLALCRALVEAHGGTISAGEASEGGAAFTVLLPAVGPE